MGDVIISLGAETDGCEVCSKLLKDPEEIPCPETRFLLLHVPIYLVNPRFPKEKKEKVRKDTRKSILNKLLKAISALRNSGGGGVLVHLEGLDTKDRCLEYFNEFADVKINERIENGSLFVDLFKKNWLSEDDDRYKSVVLLTVLGSSSVDTTNFKTKLPLDNCVIDANFLSVDKLFRNETHRASPAKLRGIADKHLQESRCVQAKALYDYESYENLKLTRKNEDDRNKYFMQTLDLGGYVTAFAKIKKGGSFYLGIDEDKEVTFHGYQSKRFVKSGFFIEEGNKAELTGFVEEAIKNRVLFLSYAVVPMTIPPDFIKLGFHEVEEGRFILEVAVGSADCLTFFDILGPESYEISEEKKIECLDVREWYRRFMNGGGPSLLTFLQELIRNAAQSGLFLLTVKIN